MPYSTNDELPAAVKKLSDHQQTIFRKAFNNALKQYKDEKKAYATAWAAAKGKTNRAMTNEELVALQERIRAFDPDYAVTEAWDVLSALQAMTAIVQLIQAESRQGEEQHVKDLIDIYTAIDRFCDDELQEALAGDNEDGGYGEDGDDGQTMGMMRASQGEKGGEGGHGGYLVTDDSGKHLPTKKGGKRDRRLMGAAWAALHGGYRGKKYAGSGKQAAIGKLKKMYEAEGMDTPSERAIEDFEAFMLSVGIGQTEAVRTAGETRFAGYALLWPKAENDLDLVGTYFTKDTDYGNYLDHADILYNHGMNKDVKLERIGKVIRAQVDDIGLWVEGELDKSKKFFRGVAELVKQGKLFWSPGTAGHLIQYMGDGKGLRSFPIVEMTLTPTPARPQLHSVAWLRAIGINLDGGADGEGTPNSRRAGGAPETQGQKRDDRQSILGLLEVNMEPKELADMIAASTQAAVRAALDAEKKVKADAEAEEARVKAEADRKDKEYKDLVAKITAEVRSSLPVRPDNRPQFNAPNYVNRESLGEFSWQRAIRGIVMSHHGMANAWSGAEKERDVMTKYADEIRSTLAENIGNLGAYLVPPQYVQEQFIPLLRSRSVVRAANPVVMQANSNVVYIPSQTGGATAYWVGENATITASNLTVGQVAITIKKLAGLEYVSNELLADSNPSVDQLIRSDLAAVLSLAEDTAYLTSDGTANAPLGLPNLPGITSLTCASDSGNGGAIQAVDIFAMKRKMMQNNIPNDGWAWFASPRTWDEIAQLKDSQARYLLETLTGGNIAQYPAYGTYPTGPETNYLGSVVGRLLGWPMFVTNNIPETQTQGSTATCSSLYLVRMPDVIIAERAGLELMATNVAGTSFATDQTWIRAIMRVGFTVRHAPGVTITKGLT